MTILGKNIYTKPIKIGIIFSVITLLLYSIGPYVYKPKNEFMFWFFIGVYNISMYVGFVLGSRRKYKVNPDQDFPIKNVMGVLFWISLAVSLPMYLIFTGTTTYGFSINRIMVGVATVFDSAAQDLYAEKQTLKNVTGIWQYINYIIVFCSPFHWAYMLLSMLLWKQLSALKKVGTVIIWLLYILQYLTTGTNVGIFTFVVDLTVVSIIRRIVFKKRRKKMYSETKGVLSVLIAAVVLVFVFDTIMGSRIGETSKGGVKINKESPILVTTPPSLRPVLFYFTSYLAQPYNALGMAIGEPFDSTLGVGYSFYLLDEIDSDKSGLWEHTYNMKIDRDYGYDYYTNWHTPYVWFANDVSFWGVPIILFILFWYFGMQWRNFIDTKNLFSFLVSMLFVLFMMFISTNNQVFQNVSMFLSFWLLFIFNRWSRTFRWNLQINGKI